MTTEAYRDASLPVEERVADLLARMTVEEKAGQVTQYFHFGSMFADMGQGEGNAGADEGSADFFGAITLPAAVEAEVAAGRAGSVLFVRDVAESNRIQRMAVEQTRLGIPVIFGFDVIHGMRTIFPAPIGLAATWDPETIEAAQAVAAREARAHGIHWTFAPMVDIARDPRWGRMFEGAGEDPYLGGAVAAAQVRGFQGDLGAENVIAGPKHFAGYGAAVGGRDYEESEISDSELWNVYLPPFKAAIDAGAGNLMSAYMELNGVPATGNQWLLTEVLRNEWGFEGWVVSDANAVFSLETQRFAKDQADAGVRALNAGLDMEMTMFTPAYSYLPDAVADGRVDVAVLDASVSRILAAKFRLGLFENPYTDEALGAEVLGAPEHGEAARRAGEHAVVLLKNDGVLPLDRTSITKLAVIGQLGASKRDTLGSWAFDFALDDTVTVLEALTQAVGPDVDVTYAPGASIPEKKHKSFFDAGTQPDAMTPDDYDDDAEIARAVALAAESDVTVVVVGERQTQSGEFASRSTLELPPRQVEQLEAIAATGTKIVLLVMSPRPLDLRWAKDNASAIVDIWHPGTRGAEGVASVLVGEASPAGRLPFSWPRHVGQVPMYYGHMTTFQPEGAATRYWDDETTPLFPFGFGLSYANFEYANLRLSRASIARGESVTVSVDVTNTSHIEADEVVQLYIHQRHGSAARPVRELKGFRRVEFAAGETQTVSFELTPAELTYWSAATRGWVQDATVFDVWVGGDSTADLGVELTVN